MSVVGSGLLYVVHMGTTSAVWPTAQAVLVLYQGMLLSALKMYWICFAVVGLLTSILFLGYTIANSREGGQITYQSLIRTLPQTLKRKGGRRGDVHRWEDLRKAL
jgi:hypothetical protein